MDKTIPAILLMVVMALIAFSESESIGLLK